MHNVDENVSFQLFLIFGFVGGNSLYEHECWRSYSKAIHHTP